MFLHNRTMAFSYITETNSAILCTESCIIYIYTNISFFHVTPMCHAPRICGRRYGKNIIRRFLISAYLNRYVRLRRIRCYLHHRIRTRILRYYTNRFKRKEQLLRILQYALYFDEHYNTSIWQRKMLIDCNILSFYLVGKGKYHYFLTNLQIIEDIYYSGWYYSERNYYLWSEKMRFIFEFITYNIHKRNLISLVVVPAFYRHSVIHLRTRNIWMSNCAVLLEALISIVETMYNTLIKLNAYADECRIHFPGIRVRHNLEKAFRYFWDGGYGWSGENIRNHNYMLSDADAVKRMLIKRAGLLYRRWLDIRSRDEQRIRIRFRTTSESGMLNAIRRTNIHNVMYRKIKSILKDYSSVLTILFLGRISRIVNNAFIRFASYKRHSSNITYLWNTPVSSDLTWDKRIKWCTFGYRKHLNSKKYIRHDSLCDVYYSYRRSHSRIRKRIFEYEYVMALYAKRTFWRYNYKRKRVAEREVSWQTLSADIHSYLYAYSYDKQKYSERYGIIYVANNVTASNILSDIRFMLRDKQSDYTAPSKALVWLLELETSIWVLINAYANTAYNIRADVVRVFIQVLTEYWRTILLVFNFILCVYIYFLRALQNTIANISWALGNMLCYIERVYFPKISHLALVLSRYEVPGTWPHIFFTNIPGILCNLRDKQAHDGGDNDSVIQAIYSIIANRLSVMSRICSTKAVSFRYTLANILSSSWSDQVWLLFLEILHSSRDKQRYIRGLSRLSIRPSRYEQTLNLAECLWHGALNELSDMRHMFHIHIISDANAYYLSRWFMQHMFSGLLRCLYNSIDPVKTVILKRLLNRHKVWRCLPDALWEQTFHMHTRHKVVPDACHLLMEGYAKNLHRLRTDVDLYMLFDYDLVNYDLQWMKWDIFDTVSLSVQYLSDFSALYPHPILEAYTQLFSHYFNTVRVKCLVDLRTLIIYNTEIVFVCAGVLRHLLILLLSFYGYDEQARLARVIRSLYESLESHIESSYYTLRTKYQYNYSLRRKHKTSNGALIYIEMFEALGLHISRQQPIGSRNSVSILRYTRRYLSQLSYVRRFDIACTVSSTVDVLTEMINETMIARQKGCHKHRKKFKVKVKAEAKAKVDSITRFWNRIHKYVFHGNR